MGLVPIKLLNNTPSRKRLLKIKDEDGYSLDNADVKVNLADNAFNRTLGEEKVSRFPNL